jgi:hypothetical protein
VAVDSRVALWREEHRCSGSWLRASCDGMRGVATTTLDLCTRPRFLLVFPRPKCFFFVSLSNLGEILAMDFFSQGP